MVVFLGTASTSAALATDYPTKPVRIIVPTVAGGGLDTLTRMIAEGLNKKMGAVFVADNRPGAGGAIGIGLAARATPDGYTLVAISGTHAATSTLQGRGKYDLLRDFVPVSWATTQPYVLIVRPDVAATSVAGLIALAKARPDTINYGSPGTGSMQHLAGLLLSSLSHARFSHIPYKGGAQVFNDVLGGQIQMSFTNYLVCKSSISAGRLRALAVTTVKRSPALPDVPTIAETLPGYNVDNWYGVIAPINTPVSILDALHGEIVSILQQADIQQRLTADASQVVTVSREEFGQHLAREVAKWGDLIKREGLTNR